MAEKRYIIQLADSEYFRYMLGSWDGDVVTTRHPAEAHTFPPSAIGFMMALFKSRHIEATMVERDEGKQA